MVFTFALRLAGGAFFCAMALELPGFGAAAFCFPLPFDPPDNGFAPLATFAFDFAFTLASTFFFASAFFFAMPFDLPFCSAAAAATAAAAAAAEVFFLLRPSAGLKLASFLLGGIAAAGAKTGFERQKNVKIRRANRLIFDRVAFEEEEGIGIASDLVKVRVRIRQSLGYYLRSVDTRKPRDRNDSPTSV